MAKNIPPFLPESLGHHRLGGTQLHLSGSQVYSRQTEHFSGSVKSSRPDSPDGVVSPAPCVRQVLLGVWLSPSRPLHHQGQQQASSICVPGARSASMETRRPASSFGSPRHLRLSSVCSAPSSHRMSHGVGGSSVTPSSSTLASEGVVRGPTRPSRHRTSQALKSVGPPCTASHPELPSRP